jgi:hypothetical protein
VSDPEPTNSVGREPPPQPPLAKLKTRNVSPHMIDLGGDVTGNGISKLVFTILSAVAEAERDRIRERVAQVKQDQKERGRYLGTACSPAGARCKHRPWTSLFAPRCPAHLPDCAATPPQLVTVGSPHRSACC